MALTRKLLTALGIDADKIEQIIDAHTETVDGLKQQIAQYKSDAEKLPEVQRQLDEAKEAAKNSGDAAKIQADFDAYKAQVESDKAKAAKKSVLEKLAKDAGLSEAGIAKAVKYTDFDKIELNDKGEAKDGASIIKGLKEEWPEYISTQRTDGARTPAPPSSGGGADYDSMSDAEFYKATYEANKKK